MSEVIVQVENLHKTYGTHVAVDNVSCEIKAGEIFGFLGPNGAGKTTTVEAIAGLRSIEGGTIRVLGIDPQRDPQKLREHVGVQLQESMLPAKISVIEALRLYASFYADPAAPEELLAMVGLVQHRRQKYAALSGGQKQRLSIALALLGKPRVAILDELTTGLDPQARRETWAMIERVRDSGVTILLVTHFMDEAERLCDRLVVIDQGTVVASGSPRELTRAAQQERALRVRLPRALDQAGEAAISLLRSLPEVHSVEQFPDAEWHITGGERLLPATVIALNDSGIIPEEVHTVMPSLEDVFVDLISGSKQRIEAL